MKTHFYLARHGETVWNKAQRFQGQLDSELTENGRQQAENIAKRLENSKISQIISSTLGRAIASAKICQQILNTPLSTQAGLIERHLGQWQGHTLSELQHQPHYHEIFQQFSQHKPVGGESAINCAERIAQSLMQLANNHIQHRLLVIVHGEALRCLLAKLGHNSNASAYDLFNNGDIVALTYVHQVGEFQLNS